ncbi:MAG: hypothetical protein PHX30_04850 [Candidatus Pacebacteria bacterium]|jgi:hypothetical protein|nr:hypothetical protein [Candidatus Paceibacterota bacterium]
MAKISIIELLYFMEYYVRMFRKDIEFALIPVSIEEKEALLVGFINFSGAHNCVDFAMYTSDLKKEHKQVNQNVLAGLSQENKFWISNLLKIYAKWYTPGAIVAIERNSHMNEIEGKPLLSQTEAKEIIKKFLRFTRKNFRFA